MRQSRAFASGGRKAAFGVTESPQLAGICRPRGDLIALMLEPPYNIKAPSALASPVTPQMIKVTLREDGMT